MRETNRRACLLLLLAGFSLGAPVLQAQSAGTAMALRVDAREASRGILHAEMEIPARPGPLTLLYPKWIPGNHAPTGPVADLVGLKVRAGGRDLAWERDPLDMYAFRVNVPVGAQAVTVAFDSLATVGSPHLTVLNWIRTVLYPQGSDVDELRVATSLRLPPGWKFGTALPVLRETPEAVEFQPVSMTTLADSPVIAGNYFRRVPLSDGADVAHYLDMAADSQAALELTPELIGKYRQLVAEASALFGSRHYERYHFLVALSEQVPWGGLEHHESSDNRLPEKGLTEDSPRKVYADLLPHEFVHSWNGKYRRPEGLVRRDFNQPIQTDLLWVYEGFTDYLGGVLAARSGLWSPQDFRDSLADTAAFLDNRPGRTWRPLADTTVAAQILRGAPVAWSAWRRGQDYYVESVLIWLEADTILREKSQGRYSLDDLARRFHGGRSGPPAVSPFSSEDVFAALAELVPHDWKGFFGERLNSTAARAPMNGIEASGWRTAFRDTQSDFSKAIEATSKTTDLRYSIGLSLAQDGVVRDIIPGAPAAQAGMAPGMKLMAVNGRRYSPALLREAIKNAKGTAGPIELLVEDREFYKTYRVDYHDGERYPHLERDESRPDLLEEIIRPRASSAAATGP
jgi:predicted metalloprotease with PDZ domain